MTKHFVNCCWVNLNGKITVSQQHLNRINRTPRMTYVIIIDFKSTHAVFKQPEWSKILLPQRKELSTSIYKNIDIQCPDI